MNHRATLGALLLGLLVFLVGCGSQAAAPTPTALPPLPTRSATPLVVLVTDVGGLHDRSFNQMAWQGLQRAKSRLGVQIDEHESASTSDYVPLLTQAAQANADLVIAVGGSMAPSLYAVAGRYPHEHFAIVDARPQSSPGHESMLPNVVNLLFREQEAGYLAGALAGLMERHKVGFATHNTIAWLGGQDIPPVDRYLAGFEAGARHEDPSIIILRDFAGTFGSPGIGRSVANRQAGSGADVFFQVAAETGSAYLQRAGARHRYGIGVDTDQSYLGPNIIASAIKRVDVAVFDAVKTQKSGKFRPFDRYFGAVDNGVGLAGPSAVVPAAITRSIRAIQHQIAAGAIKPPVRLSAR